MMTTEEREWAYAVADACLDGGHVVGGGHTVDAFAAGAEWALAGMAVCEFLADLARIYAQCPRCSGFGEYNVARGYRDPARYVRCYFCRGTGKRVTP